MSGQDEPSYMVFARANVRDGYSTSHTIVRALLERIDRPQPVAVVHVAHDMEAHARSFNEGYEAAVTQGLADDPTLADDWFQAQLREARAQALEDAAKQMREERQSWCLDDAGRYWIKRTLDDLAERATAERSGQ